MKLPSLPANINGQRAVACYTFPDLMLCIAMTKDYKIWKLDFDQRNDWFEYEPDLLELALHGKTVEIEIIRKLQNIPRSSSGRTRPFEGCNQGSNP